MTLPSNIKLLDGTVKASGILQCELIFVTTLSHHGPSAAGGTRIGKGGREDRRSLQEDKKLAQKQTGFLEGRARITGG